MSVYGKASGAQLGEQTKKVHEMGIDLTSKVDDVHSLASGQAVLASGTFSVRYSNNPNVKPGDTLTCNLMRVLVKEGSDWKIAAQSLTRQSSAIGNGRFELHKQVVGKSAVEWIAAPI